MLKLIIDKKFKLIIYPEIDYVILVIDMNCQICLINKILIYATFNNILIIKKLYMNKLILNG